MGHSTHQHTVLDDGRAAHALHDAAGQFQQVRVSDAKDHVLGRFVL